MVKNKNRFFLILLVVGFMVIRSSQINPAQASEGVPNTPENKQIMAVINRAYQLMTHASHTYDVSEFPSVFIDTHDYKLSEQQENALVAILGINSDDAENAGYLTAMQAQYISMGKGAILLREAIEKAKLENRKLTAEEFQEIVKSNHGQLPSSGISIASSTNITFVSIEINGDKAIVRYDDGAALQEAILVKVHRWLIASIVPIRIHF